MKKITLIYASLIFILAACSIPYKAIDTVAYRIYDKPYTIYGRVLDVTGNPIDNCNVVIIKRKSMFNIFYRGYTNVIKRKSIFNIFYRGYTNVINALNDDCLRAKEAILAEYPVIPTDDGGSFNIMIEPKEANDLWVYVGADHLGYKSRFEPLNELIGHTFFEHGGNNPVMLSSIVLDYAEIAEEEAQPEEEAPSEE